MDYFSLKTLTIKVSSPVFSVGKLSQLILSPIVGNLDKRPNSPEFLVYQWVQHPSRVTEVVGLNRTRDSCLLFSCRFTCFESKLVYQSIYTSHFFLFLGLQDRAVGGLNEQKLKYAHLTEHISTLAEVVKTIKPTVIIGENLTRLVKHLASVRWLRPGPRFSKVPKLFGCHNFLCISRTERIEVVKSLQPLYFLLP